MADGGRDLGDLMRGVAAGDRAAFETLYRRTSAKLFGVVLGLLGRRGVAEEVLQDVYVRIWERAGTFDPSRGSPIAWMAAVARNRALDELRRVRAGPAVELSAEADAASDAPDVLQGMENDERLRAMIACLGQLDPEKRDAVLLAYYRGYSREALSRRYGRPVPTIKTWLHRSLLQLRQCLAR